MLGVAIKVFGALFPFLQEIFISKKNNKKRKIPLFFVTAWFKRSMIAVGLASFILVFCLGKLYLESKNELKAIRDKEQRVPTKPLEPEAPSAPPPPPPPEKVYPIPDASNNTLTRYPKTPIKKNKIQYHPPDPVEQQVIEKIEEINKLGQDK